MIPIIGPTPLLLESLEIYPRRYLESLNTSTPTQHATSMEGLMTNHQMQECLQNCQQCHAICTETAQHCLQMGGKHAEADHIRLLLDCAQICQTSADFMLRGSHLHTRTCGACAEICRACAEACERIGGDDTMMKKCAKVCRRCAESCHQMAQAKSKA